MGILLLPLASAVAVGGPVSTAAAQVPAFDVDPEANARAAEVAEFLVPGLEADPTFAGTAILATGLEISAVGGGGELLRRVVADSSRTYADVPVTIRNVKRSRADLLKITADLDARAVELRDRGIRMAMWGPDYASNTVSITLEAATDDSLALTEPYASGSVQVADSYETNTPATRENDTSPFYGGNHITGPLNCTSWFSTYKSGVAYRAFTAAHCTSGTWKVAAGAQIGSTTSSNWTGSVDAQAISASSLARYVWADPNASTRLVKSTSSTQPVGTLVCTDGYVNKEICNVEVLNDDISVTYGGHTVTHTVRAHQKANLSAFTGGNSGGPVYSLVTGGVTARGMVYSRSTDDSYGNYGKQQYITSAFGYPIMLG